MVDGGQERLVTTPFGAFSYTLTRKKVRNLNLRVGQDGSIHLSIPMRTSLQAADGMVLRHARWIARCLEDREKIIPLDQLPPLPAREECRRILLQALDRAYPMVEGFGVPRPQLRLRAMKSLWGSCHMRQGYVLLNTALTRCPEPLQDYVALHELVHFLHPNHQAGFRAVMDRLMPDWKDRRTRLSLYVALLRSPG